MNEYSVDYWKAWKAKCQDESRENSPLDKKTCQLDLYSQQLELDYKRQREYQRQTDPVSSTSRRLHPTIFSKAHRFKTPDLPVSFTIDLKTQDVVHKSTKGVSFPQSTRSDWQKVFQGEKNSQCGPGSYYPSSSALESRKEFSFPQAKTRDNLINESTPGAEYEIKTLDRKIPISFSLSKRWKEENPSLQMTPAPDTYHLRSSFPTLGLPKHVPKPRESKVDGKVSFGYGCKIEEHVKYGKCVDGKCHDRARWEKRKKKTRSQQVSTRPVLHFAVEQRNLQLVERLIDSGEALNVQDQCGDTALHIACRLALIPIVYRLLGAKTHVNAVNFKGETCIHLAAATNQDRLVALLIENGGRVDMRDNQGQTPLDCCGSNQKVYQMLRAEYLKADLQDQVDAMVAKQEKQQAEKRYLDQEMRIQRLKQQLLE